MQRLSINDLAAMIMAVDESQHFSLSPTIRKRLRTFYKQAAALQDEYRAGLKGGSKNRYLRFFLKSETLQSANAAESQPTKER